MVCLSSHGYSKGVVCYYGNVKGFISINSCIVY